VIARSPNQYHNNRLAPTDLRGLFFPMSENDYYLEVVTNNDIRVKSTRVGIELILSAYLSGNQPEEIALEYPTVSLEQVHGVIAYYLRNRSETDAYLQNWLKEARLQRKMQASGNEPAVIGRLRKLAKEQLTR
jgi:uncharacterized protein (DUF433 family)